MPPHFEWILFPLITWFKFLQKEIEDVKIYEQQADNIKRDFYLDVYTILNRI